MCLSDFEEHPQTNGENNPVVCLRRPTGLSHLPSGYFTVCSGIRLAHEVAVKSHETSI